MAGKKHFTLNVINQEGIVYYGDCSVLFVPGEHDIVAVMPYHEPMIMKLFKGIISMREGHHNTQITEINDGVMYVGENEVSVLVR